MYKVLLNKVLIQHTNTIKILLFILNVFLYSFVFSWKFALLIMIAIGVHESGHVWAMHKRKIETLGFFFIPFFGAVALAKHKYSSYNERFVVAIMGPLWGMLLAMLTWIGYLLTDNMYLAVAAYWQAFINFVNLLPAGPLDGGHIVSGILSSIDRRLGLFFSILSIIGFICLLYIYPTNLLIIIVIGLAIRDLFLILSSKNTDIEKLSTQESIMAGMSYLTLVFILYTILSFTSIHSHNLYYLYLNI